MTGQKTNIVKRLINKLFPEKSIFCGIKNECCIDENINLTESFDGDRRLWQCQKCHRCFTVKEKSHD